MNHTLIQNLLDQQKKLVQKIPNLKHYFINIHVPHLGLTVPFLPIRCFRDFDLHADFTEKTADKYKIFLSSGSTGNKRSRHIFSSAPLKNYERHTCKGFSRFLNRHGLTKETPIISLVPSPHVWPTSSLAAMIEMFAQNHFKILWCDIEEKNEGLITCLKSIPNHTSCLIFGTTFHHLMLANSQDKIFKSELQKHFQRLDISIVDTGGTKGRTGALTLQQTIEVLRNFYTSPNFSFFSEYGMCELSSQAWSSKKIHDGSFTCNETLIPFSISLEKNCALPHTEKGFIGFIDIVNEESWEAIITEDVGFTYNEKNFHLIGRGPDASIKGCSLNVRNHFTFDETSEKKLVPIVEPLDSVHSEIPSSRGGPVGETTGSMRISDHITEDICKILKDQKNWDSYSINDFQKIAASIDNGIPLNPAFKNKNLFIISAANTPIAWLFPYLIAAMNHANSITIKVPTLRLDDYFAQNMTEKTIDLIHIMAQHFPATKTYIDSNKSISHIFNNYDIVLTFGTDETLQTISQQIDQAKTKFIGKGDIKNSLTVNIQDKLPQDIVNLCSLWNGRGCLTPVVLFLEGDASKIRTWTKEFSLKLEEEFLSRFKDYNFNLVPEFFHAHNCAFTRGQLKQLGLDDFSHIHRGKLTCVVNLAACSANELKDFEPELSFGGCGFVYLFPTFLQRHFSALKELPVLPAIGEYFV